MYKLLICIAALFLVGCGTTAEITNTWVDPKFKQKDLQGVLVIAIADNQESRVAFEKAYTEALRNKGVNAVASYTLVPGKANKENILSAAKKERLDTLLVSHYAGTIEEPVYHQGTTYYGVVPAYGGAYNHRFGGYYGQVVEIGSTPDVWTTNKYVLLVSDLYEAATEERIWQATSKSLNPNDRAELRDAFIEAFTDQMAEQGFFNK